MITTVFGSFKNFDELNNAIQKLKSQGFTPLQINWKNDSATMHVTEPHPQADKTEIAAGLACGALSGATIGILAGTLWGLSTINGATTGAGLTLESLSQLLTFIGLGVLAGAVIGTLLLITLVKLGRAGQQNDLYSREIKKEDVLIAVTTPEERVAEVKNLLHEARAVEGSIL